MSRARRAQPEELLVCTQTVLDSKGSAAATEWNERRVSAAIDKGVERVRGKLNGQDQKDLKATMLASGMGSKSASLSFFCCGVSGCRIWRLRV